MRIEVEYIEPLPANAQLTLEAAVRYFQSCCDGVNPDAIDDVDTSKYLFYHGIDNLAGGRPLPFETPRWDVSPEEKLRYAIEMLSGKNRNYSLRKLEHSFTQHAKELGDIDTPAHRKALVMYMTYQSVVQSFQKKNFDCFSRKDKVYVCFVNDDDEEEGGTRQRFLTTPAQLHFIQWYVSYGVYEYIDSFSDEITTHMQAKRSTHRHRRGQEQEQEQGRKKKRQRRAEQEQGRELVSTAQGDTTSTLQTLATECYGLPLVF